MNDVYLYYKCIVSMFIYYIYLFYKCAVNILRVGNKGEIVGGGTKVIEGGMIGGQEQKIRGCRGG